MLGKRQASLDLETIHHEMLVDKMRYRKAIKDKSNQNLLLVSNDLHDCLVKKDFTKFLEDLE